MGHYLPPGPAMAPGEVPPCEGCPSLFSLANEHPVLLGVAGGKFSGLPGVQRWEAFACQAICLKHTFQHLRWPLNGSLSGGLRAYEWVCLTVPLCPEIQPWWGLVFLYQTGEVHWGFWRKHKQTKTQPKKPPTPQQKLWEQKISTQLDTKQINKDTNYVEKHVQKKFVWVDEDTGVVLSVLLASHIRSRNCFCFFGSWGSGLLPYSEHASFDSTRKVKICQITFAVKGQL